ncbi:MAG: HEAT repeat domain-containing protein [Nitrospirae bacterium]|nr:HEAT repeat domain-containing protein [Nitrospirota bacterium]
MKKMIADYMENGFLENIVDMFRHDKSLYTTIGDMLVDERSRVRLGAVALVEILMTEDINNILKALPGIVEALKNPNPTIRGDAAYLLGIIGHENALPFLLEAVNDENELVREAAIESIGAIKSRDKSLLS